MMNQEEHLLVTVLNLKLQWLLVNGRIKITGAGADAAARQAYERDRGVTFKSCAPFTKYISRINNTEIDNAKDIDIVMPSTT